jgi:endonuclease/exonuclease/phosphatase family metal-dependent hydrolase
MSIDYAQPYGPPIETRVRLVTWNVWARFGPWAARQRAIAETLSRLDPDLVALEETWSAPEGTLAEALSPALSLPYHAEAGEWPLGEGVTSGCALLSRWPIARSEARPLPGAEGDPVGATLVAEVDGPRGALQVIVAILTWRPGDGRVRQEQVRALAALVRDLGRPRGPTVLCGDFNAPPDADEVRMLTGRAAAPVPGLAFQDAWELAGHGAGHTWSNANSWAAPALLPDRRIDYVFSAWPRRGGAGHPVRCELVGTQPVDGVLPSDHYGVLAELRY